MNSPSNKELILGILVVAAGALNAYLWHKAIFTDEFKNTAFYSWPVISLLVFAVLFSMSCAFIHDRWARRSTAVIALTLNYLFIPYSSSVLLAAAVTALIGWYASGEISKEAATSNYFGARKILKNGLPVFFTALAFVLAVFYFSFTSAKTSQSIFPRYLFDITIPALDSQIQKILPGFSPNSSADQLILVFASRQLGDKLDVSELPPAEREKLLNDSRKALSRELGFEISGQEKGSDILFQAANAQVEKFAGPYREYLPLLAAFGFFLAVKTFTLPMYWIALILFAGIVKLLLAVRILKKEAAIITIEKIKL